MRRGRSVKMLQPTKGSTAQRPAPAARTSMVNVHQAAEQETNLLTSQVQVQVNKLHAANGDGSDAKPKTGAELMASRLKTAATSVVASLNTGRITSNKVFMLLNLICVVQVRA